MADMWHTRKQWVWWHAQLIFITTPHEHVFTSNSVTSYKENPFSAVSKNPLKTMYTFMIQSNSFIMYDAKC